MKCPPTKCTYGLSHAGENSVSVFHVLASLWFCAGFSETGSDTRLCKPDICRKRPRTRERDLDTRKGCFAYSHVSSRPISRTVILRNEHKAPFVRCPTASGRCLHHDEGIEAHNPANSASKSRTIVELSELMSVSRHLRLISRTRIVSISSLGCPLKFILPCVIDIYHMLESEGKRYLVHSLAVRPVRRIEQHTTCH